MALYLRFEKREGVIFVKAVERNVSLQMYNSLKSTLKQQIFVENFPLETIFAFNLSPIDLPGAKGKIKATFIFNSDILHYLFVKSFPSKQKIKKQQRYLSKLRFD